MAEELTLQQLLRQRTAVERHEGLVGTAAGAVDGPRHQLLAGARGAGDQHADVGGGDHARLLQQPLHLGAVGDDLGAPGVVALGHHPWCLGQRLLDGGEQLVAVHRLGQEAEHPLAGGADGVGDRAVGGEQDHRQPRHLALYLAEQRQAVHLVHAQVGKYQVGAVDLQGAQRLAAALGGGHPVAAALQAHAQQLEQADVVIHQQDMRRLPSAGAAGRRHAGGVGAALQGEQGLHGVASLRVRTAVAG